MATKLSINPSHIAVGSLFGTNLIFRLPKYQRYYAWTAEEIDDFLKDLESCRSARAAGILRSHFFGGLVTVLQPITGSTRQNHEVVDGQQRLASFVMLVVQLKKAMLDLAPTLPSSKAGLSKFLREKSESLKKQYEFFDDTINLAVVTIPRLELSAPDKDFYEKLLDGQNPQPGRKSHELLQGAFTRIEQYLAQVVKKCTTPEKKVQALADIAAVLQEDWTVIHMATQTHGEAYMLFQVLNDRGLGLTEGELLRAKTLELLDASGSATQQATVEKSWDSILATDSERVEDGLRWLYASYKGTRPGKATLFDDCLDQFFPMHSQVSLSKTDAVNLINTVKILESEFQLISSLVEGDWPYDLKAPLTKWDADRLRLLVVELKHTNCIPLLIAAKLLTQKQYSEMVHMLEKFVFRYKIVVNAHIGPATTFYQQQAIAIRNSPGTYNVKTFKQGLESLIKTYADDTKFKARIQELEYSTQATNKPLKYFLLTLEHYAASVAGGAKKITGDKSRLFDFSNTTIEHIYPANAKTKIATLEPLINSLGNLTILGQADNNAAGCEDFVTKKNIFHNSTVWLNREIAKQSSWIDANVQNRSKDMADMAAKIFVP